MIFYLAFKNVVSRKSSAVIVLFIAFAVALFVVTNSVFDSTEDGVRESFTASFTGDVLIRPKYDVSLSLFGDETPFTGEFSTIPEIQHFEEISSVLKTTPNVDGFIAQLSGRAVMDFKGRKEPCFLFGADAHEYFDFMPALRIVQGEPFSDEGLMLPRQFANELEINVGDDVQFIIADGLASRIQAVKLTGIYEYPSENAAFDHLALIDEDTFRELVGQSNAMNVFQDDENSIFDDIDSLFDDSFDSSVLDFEEIETIEEESKPISKMWNFILVRTKKPSAVIFSLNKTFKKNDWDVEAVGWRSAAGNSALYLYMLRLVLNAGISVILIAGFVIVNNALVVGVLDRTRELGTIRSLGASRTFVSCECMAETMILSIFAGIVGVIFGIAGAFLLGKIGINLNNQFLCDLFGADKLSTRITVSNVIRSFLVAAIIGLVAWIRPVFVTLRASPVSAMQGVVR